MVTVNAGLVTLAPGSVCILCDYLEHVMVEDAGVCSAGVGHVATIGGGLGTTEVVNKGVPEVGGISTGSGTESLPEEGTN